MDHLVKKSTFLPESNSLDKKKMFLAIMTAILTFGFLAARGGTAPVSKEWQKQVRSIVWVAYSPTNANPQKGEEPATDSLRQDLSLLRQAGFTGLVTYSASGMLGGGFPALAKSQGFKGLIMGVWDPKNEAELAAAQAAAKSSIVLAYCVGNEGLDKQYQRKELSEAMQRLRAGAGKPVATTEEYDDYGDEEILALGDWVFPNAHPYFHSRSEPKAAVRWTVEAFKDMKKRTDRFLLFKEVGLPTAGESRTKLSEAGQAEYYLKLAKTEVCFVYFEAFDLPWKNSLPVEPHWGIFHSDRTPKTLGYRLQGKQPPSETSSQPSSGQKAFFVFSDADSSTNHFKPTGYMGDCGDIHIEEACETNPHSGKTCIRVAYDAKGKGPNECDYSPPCKWAGAYWQHPPNNWGKSAANKGKGFDLSAYKRLVFWARAEKECSVEFKVGGIDQPYGDSLSFARSTRAKLTTEWKEYEIKLDNADLKHIIGGFCWDSSWDSAPQGVAFFLDDIRFEK